MSSSATFESVWEEFLNKVRPYSALQKKHILQETIISLQAVLSAMPQPRQDGSDVPMASPVGANKRLLPNIENLIYDRMHQVGEDKSLFLRFDPKSSGQMGSAQFVASIASIGITLTDEEVSALAGKFPGNEEDSICWSDLWKYLQAAAEVPRSTNQAAFNTAQLNRANASGSNLANLLTALPPDSVEKRMARGLKVMRETMYQKSSNFHNLFLNLQNQQTKQVAVNDLLPQLTKLGFPSGLCSEDELRETASRACKVPGSLTYGEFLAFCTGHDATAPATAGSGGAGANDGSLSSSSSVGALDSPALMNALVKLNNLNLRKFFKDCDDDADGLLTSAQLAQGLVEFGGMHPAQAKDQALLAYLETFSKRKAGHFGYAEFIKFVNTRINGASGPINGQPGVHASAALRLPEESSPSQMLEMIVKTMRTSQLSVESMFNQFDCDMDGALDEAEFYQGLCSLGFSLTQQQSKSFFEAVDVNKNGVVEISEFAQLIVNPAKNPKLSTRVRHAPGGASSVPMGSYAPGVEAEAAARPSTGRGHASNGSRHDLNLAQAQTPLSKEEQQQNRPSMKYVQPEISIDLTFQQQSQQQSQTLQPHSPADFNNGNDVGSPSPRSGAGASPRPQSAQTQGGGRGRNPPGGKSSIDFVHDHGAVTPRTSSTGTGANKGADANLLHFDPTHPVAVVRPRTAGAPGASSTISLTDEPEPTSATLQTPQRVRPACATSTISFNQADSDVLHTGRKVLASPGGNTSLTLSFEDMAPPSPSPVAPVFRAQDELNISLAFDPNAPIAQSERRMKSSPGSVPLSHSNMLAHSSSRVDSDLAEDNHLSHHRTRKHTQDGSSHVPLGSDSGSALVDSYKPESVEIDPAVIAALSTAIYAHSQRLRHTFQEWNKNSQNSALSKENFVSGARALKVALTDAEADALFARFDADGDGEITYSEFVRLLASK